MMIVSVMRGGLRNEFEMADEVFALSPISARAVLPSEEDYDAISQAFMETSRGRWFLGEYAKRNRNSDTRMVLDAVARIEDTLAAQKQPPPAENVLPRALASIRAAVEQAKSAATSIVENFAVEENLAPVRKAARIIREISWRWREIGADARICDLLDSQVGAIEGACDQIASTSPEPALSAAFDLINARIAQFDEGDTAPAPQATKAAAPSPSSTGASDEMPAAAVASRRDISAAKDSKAGEKKQAEAFPEAAQTLEVAAQVVEAPPEPANANPEMAAEVVDAASDAANETAEAAEAYDEALLDMVALEMAAPDFIDIDEGLNETGGAEPAPTAEPTPAPEPTSAQPIMVAEKPEAAPVPPAPMPNQPSLQPSLGSTLLANGIVRKPNPAGSDPLAPIRRMSQAEKIALFS
jgi:hypothetical protein